jgi:hypothetical protein
MPKPKGEKEPCLLQPCSKNNNYIPNVALPRCPTPNLLLMKMYISIVSHINNISNPNNKKTIFF